MFKEIFEYVRTIIVSISIISTVFFIDKFRNSSIKRKLKETEIERDNLEEEIKMKDDMLLEMDVKDKLQKTKEKLNKKKTEDVYKKDSEISKKIDNMKEEDEITITV